MRVFYIADNMGSDKKDMEYGTRIFSLTDRFSFLKPVEADRPYRTCSNTHVEPTHAVKILEKR